MGIGAVRGGRRQGAPRRRRWQVTCARTPRRASLLARTDLPCPLPPLAPAAPPGVLHVLGVPYIDAAAFAAARVLASAAAVLLALLAPRRGDPEPLSPLHAALLNVTHDAQRAADLVHEFITLEADPSLQQRFLSFLTAKAASSYSRVERQLSWVLWVYSTVWMPLLVVLCLTRSARRRGGGGGGAGVPASAAVAAGGGRHRAAALANGHAPRDRDAGEWGAPLRHAASAPGRAVAECGGGGAELRRSATAGASVRRALSGGKSGGGASSRDAAWEDGDVGGGAAPDQIGRPLAAAWSVGGAPPKVPGLHPVAEDG
jgi:hypothetical protein